MATFRIVIAIAVCIAGSSCTLSTDDDSTTRSLGESDAGDHDAGGWDGGWSPDAGFEPDAGGHPDAGVCDCSAIAFEPLCIYTPGCTPLYRGIGCDCNGHDCSCELWQFTACE